jgi:hypothetical protein
MNTQNDHKRKLFQYLLWGQSTIPARFSLLSEFEAWAFPIGFISEQCRGVWICLSTFYRSLYGKPILERR